MQKAGCYSNQKEKRLKILSKTTGQIWKQFGTNGPLLTLVQGCSHYLDWWKTWPPWVLFFYYSLRAINNLSVKQGWVFLGWSGTNLGQMCLAQGPQRSDAHEARTRGPSVSSQALYHWTTAIPLAAMGVGLFFLFMYRKTSNKSSCQK